MVLSEEAWAIVVEGEVAAFESASLLITLIPIMPHCGNEGCTEGWALKAAGVALTIEPLPGPASSPAFLQSTTEGFSPQEGELPGLLLQPGEELVLVKPTWRPGDQ